LFREAQSSVDRFGLKNEQFTYYIDAINAAYHSAHDEEVALNNLGALLRDTKGVKHSDDLLIDLKVYQVESLRGAEARASSRPPERYAVIVPPGWRARDVLRFIFGRRLAERVFDQILADALEEWAEAMIDGHAWLARWIRLRVYCCLALACMAQVAVSLGSKVRDIWRLS
jgi:hypothetical protein